MEVSKMLKRISFFVGAAVIATTGYMMIPAYASSSTKTTTTTTESKLIEVRVCPIMHGMTVKGNGAGTEVVGKYKVYFCCKGCPEAFDKLTPAQKLQKAEEAYLIQQDREKKNK
ncbi:MAG: hypothetical protein ABI210_11760 [Abditibacteriaceae bacterium]